MDRFKGHFDWRKKNVPFPSAAIIGDGRRKTWNPCAPTTWDIFAISIRNRTFLTTYILPGPRTCHGLSRGFCHVAWSNDFSQRWRGMRQGLKTRALVCVMTWANEKGNFFRLENKALISPCKRRIEICSLQWKIRERISQLSPFDHTTWQHPRRNPRHGRGSARIYVVRMARSICSKNRKNCPIS